MNTQLFIAKKIKVGFNMRQETYTGKLGYVIGWDGKKWRKEPSWESWREKYISPEEVEKEKRIQYERYKERYTNPADYYKYDLAAFEKQFGTYENFQPHFRGFSPNEAINPVEYDNVPTEGFVLNKKAGGGSRGWDARATYCRVWDPRGFEFEITIPNLLFILQETNSMKGKGLEGEFVYSWDGKDLVLLPCHCEEYKKSANFTKIQSNKVGVKDLIEGASYKTKREEDLIYLGKFNWYALEYQRNTNKSIKMSHYEMPKITTIAKKYVFINKANSFLVYTKLDHLASRTSDTAVSNYAELMELFTKQKESSAPKELIATSKTFTFDEEKAVQRSGSHCDWVEGVFYEKQGDKYIAHRILPHLEYEGLWRTASNKLVFKGYYLSQEEAIELKDGVLIRTSLTYGYRWREKHYTKTELEAKGFCNLQVVLENGTKINVEEY